MVAVQFLYWRWECKIIWTAYDDLAFSCQCAPDTNAHSGIFTSHTYTAPAGVYFTLLSSAQKVSRCILKVFSPEVYTASFGVDVKCRSQGTLFKQALAFSRPTLATIVFNPSGVI